MRIEFLDRKLTQHIKEDTEQTLEREKRFKQMIMEQREEIARLRKDLEAERKDRRARRMHAKNKLKSE
jgi:hypothetical protein